MVEEAPIARLIRLHVQLARSASKQEKSPYSLVALAERTGISRTRLSRLQGTYRADKKLNSPLKADEAEKVAAAAVELLQVPALAIQRWLLAVASEREAAQVERAISKLQPAMR